jgi:uncharacterized membrane protein
MTRPTTLWIVGVVLLLASAFLFLASELPSDHAGLSWLVAFVLLVLGLCLFILGVVTKPVTRWVVGFVMMLAGTITTWYFYGFTYLHECQPVLIYTDVLVFRILLFGIALFAAGLPICIYGIAGQQKENRRISDWDGNVSRWRPNLVHRFSSTEPAEPHSTGGPDEPWSTKHITDATLVLALVQAVSWTVVFMYLLIAQCG